MTVPNGSKLYKNGMFGGKFCPMHLGHRYVLEKAMNECEMLHVFIFYNTPDELKSKMRWFMEPCFRVSQMMRCIRDLLSNGADCDCVVYTINSDVYTTEEGENWYAEANYIKRKTGKIDAVYSSEPSYDPFFKKAYKNAEHIIVDKDRIRYPVHSSELRGLSDTDFNLYRWLA